MTIRVLVTGAGGPSAVSFIQAVAGEEIELFAADIDPYAAGLHLVAPEQRMIVCRGDDPRFVDQLLHICRTHRIDVLVPTVDAELLPLAERGAAFAKAGTAVVVAKPDALRQCIDKWTLIQSCCESCAVPTTALLDDKFDADAWTFPCIVKPRRGAGGRGVVLVRNARQLAQFPHDASLIIQEYLPGAEFSVDVLSDKRGRPRAAVPRVRLKVDSGIAVAGRTVHDAALQAAAGLVTMRLGLTYVANVQFKRDAAGKPRLLEVNARFPGTMPLTVAAGVNMPRLALDMALGRELPDHVGAFTEIGIVRTWADHVIGSEAFADLEQRALALQG